MSATCEPGTVAVATVRGVPNVRVMAGYGTAEPRLRWVTTDERLVDADDDGWWFAYHVTDVRPLVTLDVSEFPADPAVEWEDVVANLRNGVMSAARTWIADQIEAQTRPPKPAEPTGLGAVVEDAEGVLWVRNPDADVHCKWRNRAQQWRNFAAIDAVRVLSEGVTQ